MLELFANKQLFTWIILALYVSNVLYQVFWTKDYIFGGYWLSAAMITVFSMQLSDR